MRKASHSRRSLHKGPHYEVSYFSQIVSMHADGPTTRGAPLLAQVEIIGQRTLAQGNQTAAPAGPIRVVDPSVRGISVKEIIYDSQFSILGGGIAAVTAYSSIAESVQVDQYAPATPTRGVHSPNWFDGEVGSGGDANEELGTATLGGAPNRTLYRRWGLMPVGAPQQPNFGGMASYWMPSTFRQVKIKRRAFLRDNDAVFAQMLLTNPTTTGLDFTWVVNGVIVYRVVR